MCFSLCPGSWSAAARRRFRVSAVSSRAKTRVYTERKRGEARRREGSAVSPLPPTCLRGTNPIFFLIHLPLYIQRRTSSISSKEAPFIAPGEVPPSAPVHQGCPSSPTGRLLWKYIHDAPWLDVENPPQVLRGASSSAAAISSLIATPSWTALPSCFRTSGRGSRPRLWDPSGMFSAKSPAQP